MNLQHKFSFIIFFLVLFAMSNAAGNSPSSHWLANDSIQTALPPQTFATSHDQTLPTAQTSLPVQCRGTDDSAALSTALASAGNGQIVIAQDQICAARDITISNLRVEPGGMLKPLTGHTVTLSGTFDAGGYQVFSNALAGQGRISFADNMSIREIYPQWWGAKGNGADDDTAPLDAALDQRGQTVFIPRGSYKTTSNLLVPVCAAIIGAGRDQTVFLPSSKVTVFLKVKSTTVVLREFEVDGAATSNATGMFFGDSVSADGWGGLVTQVRVRRFTGANGVGIRLADALKSEFTGVLVDGNNIDLLCQRVGGGLPTTVTFRNCQFIYAQAKGVKLIDGHSITFDGCVFESNREEGVLLLPDRAGTVENILFVNGCWFEDNYRSDPTRYQFVAGDGTSIGGATIRPVLRDAFFSGGEKSPRAINLNGPAVAGFVVDNVQVPPFPSEIKVQNGAYGTVSPPPNLDKSVVSQPNRL
jgi:Pectate lyase superfamily protein